MGFVVGKVVKFPLEVLPTPVAGRVVGTMALSSSVGAHGPVEFTLLPASHIVEPRHHDQGADSPIFDAVMCYAKWW